MSKKNYFFWLTLCALVTIIAVAIFVWVKKPHQLPNNYYLFSHFQGSIQPLPVEQQTTLMRDGMWGPACPVPPLNLALVRFSYWDFNGVPHVREGELVVNHTLAKEVLAIFTILYQHQFPIDTKNTIGFNCRAIVEVKGVYSEHSYGRAIDLNVLQNPISYWKNSGYLNRKNIKKGMLMNSDIAVKTFKQYGWAWGGDWTQPKDYMHFQKSLSRRAVYLALSHQWPDLTWFIYNPDYPVSHDPIRNKESRH